MRLAIISLVLFSCILHPINKKWFESFPDAKEKVPKVKILGVLPNNRVFITYIKDEFNTIYVVKQYKEFSVGRPLMMVMECLSSHIAKKMGFPFNEVRIIPERYTFPGKFYNNLPATLHKKVPGIQIKKLNKSCKYKGLTLRQKCGPGILPEDVGMTREIIFHLGRHRDLPVIAGHDTFMCDKGRHNNNLLYDKKKNRFYAIDLEKCYKYNLPLIAIRHLRTMQKPFSKQELQGLYEYKNTLKILIENYPPEKVIKLFDMFCDHILPKKRDQYNNMISNYKDMMRKSYRYAQQLVQVLSDILDKY